METENKASTEQTGEAETPKEKAQTVVGKASEEVNGEENVVEAETVAKEDSKDKTEPESPEKSTVATISDSNPVVEPAKTENEPVPDKATDATSAPAEIASKIPEKSEPVVTDTDLNIPPVQTLGKGKRARIPNKRYSDIILSPNTRSHKPANLENGEKSGQKPEKGESENDEEMAGILAVASLRSRSNTSSPAAKRAKYEVNMSNPLYLKPFELGWKREVVYRAAYDNPEKRCGDVYYYMPNGKKLRSMRDVTDNLRGRELSTENFTFYKEPVGVNDSEKEIIREAKVWTKRTATPKAGAKTPKNLSPKVQSPKVAATKAAPKIASSKAAPTPSPRKTTARNVGSFKMKLLPSKSRADKKTKSDEEPMEVDTPPAKKQAAKKTPASKVAAATRQAAAASPRGNRRSGRSNNLPIIEKVEEPKFMDNYLQNLSYGYNTLLYVFQYLKVQDLLRAGCVCTMWRDIASHPSLWRTVRMKNSQVHSFEGLANSLRKHGTVHLDLRKMLLPTNSGDDIWPEFSQSIQKVQTLRRIELCRCPASVVEKLACTNQDLEVLNAVTIRCESMSLDMLSSLKNLKELRVKSTSGLTLSSDISSLKELTNLTHLSLTSIKDLNKMDLNVIASLTNLESLDLGECSDFPSSFGEEILIKLTKLEKLRLEKGQGACHTFEILDAVRNMPQLEQLELVNFDIKSGFDTALGACSNVRKLLIIPTYISQSATTNHMVLGGVLRLQSTLSHFVWGVTLELLRVTELFVDQCEDPDKKEKKEKKSVGTGDSIPVLKPVPLITDKGDKIPPAHDPPQVEILPLPNLQKLLLHSLPTTRVKILKIPFHATWRQSITDTVN